MKCNDWTAHAIWKIVELLPQKYIDGKGHKMDKSPYIQRSSEITKIGRLEIHMDQLEHKGVVRPYSYASVPEGVHVLPIV